MWTLFAGPKMSIMYRPHCKYLKSSINILHHVIRSVRINHHVRAIRIVSFQLSVLITCTVALLIHHKLPHTYRNSGGSYKVCHMKLSPLEQ